MKKLLKKLFLPDMFVGTVFDIDAAALAESGIKAFIFDIDNTLAPYALPTADEKTLNWLNGLRERGFGVYFVSNNKTKRVRKTRACRTRQGRLNRAKDSFCAPAAI